MSGEDWESTVNNPTMVTDAERVHEATQFLSNRLWLDEKDLAGCADLNDVRAAALARLHDKLDDNVGLLHSAYGRHCGLISKRGTRNYRYAPTDAFLKTLVLANVQKRAEIADFLASVFRRYRLDLRPR